MTNLPFLAAALALCTLPALSPSIALAEPALWTVKGPHSTLYLFGSVHLLQKDKVWRSAKIDSAIRKSDELWLEVADLDQTEGLQGETMKLGMDPEHPLSTKLTPEDVAQLDGIAKQIGMPGEKAMEPMRPWLAAMTLTLLPMLKAGFDPKSGVELILKPEFDRAAKPVHGFETGLQQLHDFADLPPRIEVEYLTSSLRDFEKGTERIQQLVDAWYAGDVRRMDELVDGEWRKQNPDMYKVLVVDRNLEFAKKLEEILKGKGTFFIAVGAGHLVGPDGVPALMTKHGYEVSLQ